MNKTDHQADLNARALDADGEPVHPGLRLDCQELHCWKIEPCRTPDCTSDYPHGHMYNGAHKDECPSCHGSNIIPHADLGAQIAACQKQGWEVRFMKGGDEVVIVYEWYPSGDFEGHYGVTLTDAMFQATLTRAANWGKCPECAIPEAHREHDDSFTGDCCHGTGWILTGTGAGRIDGN